MDCIVTAPHFDLSVCECDGGGGVAWFSYREHFGLREMVAMAVIFAGVWLVKKYTRKAR